MTERRYALLDQVAAGTRTTVYRGFDRNRGRDVAVKVFLEGLSPGAGREASAAASLQHPSLVEVSDIVMAERPWLVMDYVDGPTLQDRLEQPGRIGLATAGYWGCQLLDALGVLWRAGLVHHDIKPANIVIRDGVTPVLVDFGSAMTQASASAPVSTPAFTAPEVLDGQPASPASDLYALGVCLHWMVAGQHPFPDAQGSAEAMLRAHSNERPADLRTSRPTMPNHVARRINGCLHKRPSSRTRPRALHRALAALCR